MFVQINDNTFVCYQMREYTHFQSQLVILINVLYQLPKCMMNKGITKPFQVIHYFQCIKQCESSDKINNFPMYGLKNTFSKGSISEESFVSLKKHSEEYRRGISFFAGHMHQMIKIYIEYYELFETNLTEVSNQLQGSQDVNPTFYREIVNAFKTLNKELRSFIEKASNNQKSLFQLSNLFTTDFNMLVKTFQERSRNYLSNEQNVLQTCKKYFNIHKSMLGKIQDYKNSFVNVKLIYNNEQKLRLYNDCLHTYKKMEQLIKLIQLKIDQLNLRKSQASQSYKILQKQLSNFTISFASRYVEELRKFFNSLFEMEGRRLDGFSEKLFSIERIGIKSIFESESNLKYQQYISFQINRKQCQILPSFVIYRQKINEEGQVLYKRMLLVYMNQMFGKIQHKKKINRKMFEYIQKYIKGLQKNLIDSIKETLQSFQKMRKRIGEVFGSRWISFYKIIASVFQNSIENTGRLMLRASSKFQQTETCINQQLALFSQFMKQLKGFTQKNVPKKVIKKFGLQKQLKIDDISAEEKSISAEQKMQISTFLSNLIIKYDDESRRYTLKIKQLYSQFLGQVKKCMGEYFTFFNQLNENYYKEAQYAKAYNLFQSQMESSINQGMKFFENIELSALLRETGKVTFESQFNKIQGFKKLKKPKQLQMEVSPMVNQSDNTTQNPSVGSRLSARPADYDVTVSKNETISDNLTNIIGKEVFLGEFNSRHADFLLKKISIDNTEKYVKSYSCSLSDTIILAGRLFITSHRLCFYSKFNSKNIFFGQTFINIPKTDIKKVQRRSMSLFSDNALAVTTVNGQLIFRSFFSRDATYDLIKKTFQVYNQEIFFQEEEMQEGDSIVQKQIEFDDDMKQESGKQRQLKIVKSLKQYNYVVVSDQIFQFPGLTVVKFIKMFELDQQVVINRTNFSSFAYYYKDFCQHKQIVINPWDPNPLQYLNVINLKQDSPEVYKRKVSSVVPMPPSNIPFMPKIAPTFQEQTMFLINKDKVIIESTIKNTGVPYCQVFDVRIKRTIQTHEQNKVRVTGQMFVYFAENILVKATIQSKSISSVKEGMAKMCDQMKSYLKMLEKKIQKAGKKESPEQKMKQLEQTVEEISNQSKKLKEQSKGYQKQIENLKLDLKNRGIVVIFLAVIILIELALLLR